MTTNELSYEADGLTFTWSGGPYVNVYWTDAKQLRPTDAVPFTCFNVWDYAAGASTITGQDGLATAATEWLDNNRGDLGAYLENSI